ncbi:MAG: hypothetical protein PHR51_02180 [Patescibacteria group bacterium]|nr:hypothetical protein [Patescibacteria group bacterium]
MQKAKSSNRGLYKTIEIELVIILAAVLLLGVLIGYSLAASKSSLINLEQPSQTLRIEVGGNEETLL